MFKVLEKLQALIEATPWYVYSALIILGAYNIFKHSEDLVTVVCNLFGIACLVNVLYHNWDLKTYQELQS